MEDFLPILNKCRLFNGLSEDCIRQVLLPLGTAQSYSKNTQLITPHQQVDWFGVVLEGCIQILQIFSNGATSLMQNLLPSFGLGLDLICTNSRLSPYYAISSTPVQVLIFPAEVLLQPGKIPEADRLAMQGNFLTLLSQENMRKHNRMAILSQRGLRDRVLTYLSLQASHKEASSFHIPFSREELADFLCVNRSALSHELSRMEQEGLIRFRKDRFTLLPEGEEQSAWHLSL